MVSLLAAAVISPAQLRLNQTPQLQLSAKARALPKLKVAPPILLETAKKSDSSLAWVKLINLNVILSARRSSEGKAYLYAYGCDLSGYYDQVIFSHPGKGNAPAVGAQFAPFDKAKAFLATFYIYTLVPTPLKWYTQQGEDGSSRISNAFASKGIGYETITVPIVQTASNPAFLDVGLTCEGKTTAGFILDRIELAALH